jgi:hypothetical protein
MGYLSSLGFAGVYCYNCAYCLTLRYAITNVLKVNSKFKIIVHLVSIAMTIAAPTTLYYIHDYDVNMFG